MEPKVQSLQENPKGSVLLLAVFKFLNKDRKIDQNTNVKWNMNSCYQSEFLRPKLLGSSLHLSVKWKKSSKSLDIFPT